MAFSGSLSSDRETTPDPAANRRRLLELKLRRPTDATGARPAEVGRVSASEPPLPSAPRDRPPRASFMQEQMWLLDQMEPERPVYNVATLYRLRGPLDAGALAAAFSEIVRRHENLRSSIGWTGDEARLVVHPAAPVAVPLIDLSDRGPDALAEAQRLALRHAYEPFDLARDVLLRPRLYRLGPCDHALLLGLHHMATDAWSLAILWDELATAYAALRRGAAPPLPPLAIQYADFAQWQREQIQGGLLERLLAFWRAELRGVPALDLPADHPRPPHLSYDGAVATMVLPARLMQQLEACARAENATVFMVVLAAFGVLLHRLGGQERFLVGTAVAGRQHSAAETLIGCFINMLPLRLDLGGDPTFRELVRRVRERTLTAFEHDRLPFDKLVAELGRSEDAGHRSLVQAALVLHNTPPLRPRLDGLAVETLPRPCALSRLELLVTFDAHDGAWHGLVEYSKELFAAATIERWMRHWLTLLEAVAAAPDTRAGLLPLLTPVEREQILSEWNATEAAPPPAGNLADLFLQQVARTPAAPAVIWEHGALTYLELDAHSRRVAARLRALGVGPEVLVAIGLDRSPEMIVGVLAVLRAGGAYVPLDPAQPAARLAFMLEDARPAVLLTRRELRENWPACAGKIVCLDDAGGTNVGASATESAAAIAPESLAYVIYTSGSTGQPKGVMIEHRSAVNYVADCVRRFRLGPADRVLQFASLSFDASVEEVFPALGSGAALVLRTDEMLADAPAFLAACDAQRITVLDLPTAYWHRLTSEMAAAQLALPETIRLVIIGGERALPECVRRWQRVAGERVALWNGYGPTETTVAVSFAELTRIDLDGACREAPIGRPTANTRIHLLDANQQPAPVGVIGELHVGGIQVARGYLRRPELTAERFLLDPFRPGSGARLYRTGDLARYRPDGTIEYVGRLDRQVKIRGFRIELGEIEAVLTRQTEIKEAAVIARELQPGDARLEAYLVPVRPEALDHAALRERLLAELPDYMVPAVFASLPRLPIDANGKVDRDALPAPEMDASFDGSEFVAPRSPVEQTVAAIWSSVLGLERVGIHANFFALGGHSLLAMQAASRLRSAFGIALPLRRFFEAPTVAQLAAVIDRLRNAPAPAAESADDAAPAMEEGVI